MTILTITVGEISIEVETRDTPTAHAIVAALPLTSTARTSTAMTWGDEVYFSTPLNIAREDAASTLVQAGEIAFWPDGNAIAIGFGQTPISAPGEIRLASPCNIWADALSDVTLLRPIRGGEHITVQLARS